jgi:hypothetical protein
MPKGIFAPPIVFSVSPADTVPKPVQISADLR